MTLIAVQEKYLDTLKAFGDVNAQINQVIEDYVTRRIIERVRIARENTREFEAKYAMPYATFAERVQLDEDFYNQVSQANQLWEQDALVWRHWSEELQHWNSELNDILNKS